MNLPALALFAFVSSITPGPNNVMLWASGMNFGFVRTLPHMIGINIGFASLLMAACLGLGAVFAAVPSLSIVLRVLGSLYLLYLAYRIATAAGGPEKEDVARPLSFWEAAGFQYVNPKAWTMAISSASAFLTPDQPLWVGALLLTGVFSVVNIPCIAAWAVAGTGIGKLLTSVRRRRIVNGILALLLVATIVWINL